VDDIFPLESPSLSTGEDEILQTIGEREPIRTPSVNTSIKNQKNTNFPWAKALDRQPTIYENEESTKSDQNTPKKRIISAIYYTKSSTSPDSGLGLSLSSLAIKNKEEELVSSKYDFLYKTVSASVPVRSASLAKLKGEQDFSTLSASWSDMLEEEDFAKAAKSTISRYHTKTSLSHKTKAIIRNK